MLNKAVLIGRLTKDPEMRYTPGGVAVTSFYLAVSRNYTTKKGEREADFLPIIAWRGLAETCGKHLAKGKQVAVSGRIQTRHYDAKGGQRRYVTEIVADEVQFLGRGEGKQDGSQKNKQDREQLILEGFKPIKDDDFPF